MKEKLKDRIDVLFEKAKAGEPNAQLKLSKFFYKGHLVKKSTDQAKYWAFKAIQNGNGNAQAYYQTIVTGGFRPSSKLVDLCDKISLFSIYEFAIAFIPFLIMSIFHLDDNIFYNICLWIFGVGFVSFLLSLLTGKIGEAINKAKGKSIGTGLGIVVVHVIALWLTIA